MKKPVVAIIGRPNVGKSTLFNRLVKRRKAVIDDFPGITRDRLYSNATWDNRTFIVVDTGGFEHSKDEVFSGEIKRQIMQAIDEADILLLLMDAASGITPLDQEFIDIIRKRDKKTFYIVNKIDGPRRERDLLTEFYSLGRDLYPLSALNGYGFDKLISDLITIMPESACEYKHVPRIAIVGRPNVGKSTLVNALLSKERMIVSPVPGTTRDAVDSVCRYYGKEYIIVDTAGIRRKGKMSKTVEKYSFMRTLRNIENCDVALLVLDAGEGVVELDQKIGGIIKDVRKGAVILLNKWDIAAEMGKTVDEMQQEVFRKFWFMRYAPIITISALSKKRVTKIFPIVENVINEGMRRVSTHELNTILKKTLSLREPPLYKGKKVKIYYMSQVRTAPPGFVIFTNRREGIKDQYIKFLEAQLRSNYPFEGMPVDFIVREKKK